MTAALGGYYTKAQSDAAYAPKGSSYTKTESDARYAPLPGLIRGTYNATGYSAVVGNPVSDNLSFGVTLSAPPTVHYVVSGGLLPVECAGGTVASPTAAPGHLCVFEAPGVNIGSRAINNASGFSPLSSPFGANIFVYSAGVGPVYAYGSWAVRPLALAAPAAQVPSQAEVGSRAGH